MLARLLVCTLLPIVVAACARSRSDVQPGCASDRDCKGDRLCVQGSCVGELGAAASGASRFDGGRSGTAGTFGRPAGASGSSGSPKAGTSAPLAGRPANGGSKAPTPPCSGSQCSPNAENAAPGLYALAIEARELVFDPHRQRLYATVGGAAEAHANSLVSIDPVERRVVVTTPIGSEPGTLALAEDGSTLWVSINGAYALRKVILGDGDPVVDAQYTLPPGDFGDLAWAGPMVVLPGTSASLAISLHRSGVSPSFAGVAIVDDGHPRATMTRGHTGASRLTLGPEGFVFGYNNLSTGYGFYVLAIDDDGVTQTEHDDLIMGFKTDITYAAPYVYASSGEVVDVSDPASPRRAGQFAIAGSMVVVGDGTLLAISSGTQNGPLRLHVLDLATFTERDSALLSMDRIGGVRSIVHAGPGVLAFLAQRDGENALFILDNPDFVP
jgi:hypothetical protein